MSTNVFPRKRESEREVKCVLEGEREREGESIAGIRGMRSEVNSFAVRSSLSKRRRARE